jgi:type VI secretion system protein ImpA
MIDRICAYYERYEPSSPVPLLLQRARRLVDKNFMEILQDLAPEGMSQARQVGGIENE